jgi:hypothetical protein
VTVRQETRDRVVQQAGALSTAAVRRLEADLDWYRALSAADRSWIGLVAQAGVAAFVAWLKDTGGRGRGPDQQVTAEIFGSAPRELTWSVSLGQTLDLVRNEVEDV